MRMVAAVDEKLNSTMQDKKREMIWGLMVNERKVKIMSMHTRTIKDISANETLRVITFLDSIISVDHEALKNVNARITKVRSVLIKL